MIARQTLEGVFFHRNKSVERPTEDVTPERRLEQVGRSGGEIRKILCFTLKILYTVLFSPTGCRFPAEGIQFLQTFQGFEHAMTTTFSLIRTASARFRPGLFAVAGWCGLAIVFSAVAGPAAKGGEERVTFTDSVRELPVSTRSTLHAMTAGHLGDATGFNVPLALRNQEELEARVGRGEIISGDEMKEKYFPLQSDYDTVAAWLKGEGFTVDEISDARLAVFAHGTVAQVQKSFGVTMGLITADGADHAAALSAPSLPTSIARPALGVSGLSYRRPHSRLMHPATPITNATGVPTGGYHIADIAKAYSGTGLVVNGTTLTGAGQTIGIEAYVQVKSTDLSTFWTNNSITRTGTVTTINVNNATLATDADDVEENALDVEWASGMAPGANIVDYATNYNNNDAPERNYNRAITDAGTSGSTLHTFSSSYGPSESELTSTELTAYNQIFMSMTAEGLTFVNATGDVGSSPVEAYGVFPYVFGVGGTTLDVNTTTDARATETGWSGSSGGVSANYAHPTWQTGTGTIAADKRQFPDIALAADPNTPAYFVYNSKVSEVGGTSWSAPTFAGFLALIQQGRTLNTPARGPVGFLNPRIYPLILTPNFYDVTSGSNTGYSAGTGYDMVTGVGVPTVSTFLTTLLGPTISSFTPTTGTAGTSVVITGTNFYANTGYPVTVTFNGTAAASVTVNSATQITAVAPGGVATGPIVVTSFDTATSGTSFTVGGTPDLTITKTHSGSFTQADAGDTYTLTVSNGGTGATSGTVTVTDTLPGDLTATALSGTGWTVAANNLSATRSDALAAGSSYPALTLTVNVSSTAAASVTNTATVSGGGETNTANDGASDPTSITALTPSQAWRYQYFGTTADSGNAADAANPAGDGINNLTKYALGLNPLVPTVTNVTEDTSSGYLSISIPKNANATDLTYTVQVTSDLTDPASWTSDGTTIDTDTATLLQVHDDTSVSTGGTRFLRLLITR